MKPKKFIGANAREAMRQVKEVLGPDALILSNTQVAGGVEIVALAAAAIDALVGGKPQPAQGPIPRRAPARIPAMAPRVEPAPRSEPPAARVEHVLRREPPPQRREI